MEIEKIYNDWLIENKKQFDSSMNPFEMFKAGYNQALQLRENAVISSVFCPEWLTYDIRVKVKDLWNLPNVNNSNPRTSAIKLIREIAKHNGYEIDLKKSVELVKQHCL
jgi:hypothetical protein